jgi:hypothetical protein
MYFQLSQLPALNKSFEEATADGKIWVGVDQAIQILTATDLHFFEKQEQANAFQEFNVFHYKDIGISSVDDLWRTVKDITRDELRIDPNAKTIELPMQSINTVSALNDLMQLGGLKDELDRYDWKTVSYEPNKSTFASHDERVHYNRLEWLVEQFSALAQSDHIRESVKDTLNRAWEDGPMEKHIAPVLEGTYGEKAQLIIQYKKETMNAENLEYLQKQLLFGGFGEGLNTQLERKLKEGLPDFQLNASHEFGKDKMEAVLYFSKSKQDGSDKYFFNKYDATLNNAHGEFKQTFFINNKGQSIQFGEACNLLNGRSVYKELTPKEGARYKAWVKLDFNKRDEHGNAKLNIFNEKYGFSLKEALGRVPLTELKDPEKMASLFATLESGNMGKATLIKSDREIEVQIAADPKFKTIKMFNKEGEKLYVPAQKQETQYGQAPADEKRAEQGKTLEVGQPLESAKQQENGQTKDVKQGEAVAMNNKPPSQKPANDKPLLEKKRVNKNKGKKIA